MDRARLEKELQEIQKASKDQLLHAEHVVDYARNNPDSELHKHFEWNDAVAAEQHRLQQARRLIRVAVTVLKGTNQQTRAYVSLSSERPKGGGYHDIATVVSSDTLRQMLLVDARKELKTLRRKYAELQELVHVFSAIDALQPSGTPE